MYFFRYRNSFDNPAFEDERPNSLNSSQPPDIIHAPLSSALIIDDLEMNEVPKLSPEKLEDKSKIDSVGGDLNALFQESSHPTPSSQPPPAFDENAALVVRNGYKSYKKGTPVLSDFNMTVPAKTM